MKASGSTTSKILHSQIEAGQTYRRTNEQTEKLHVAILSYQRPQRHYIHKVKQGGRTDEQINKLKNYMPPYYCIWGIKKNIVEIFLAD